MAVAVSEDEQLPDRQLGPALANLGLAIYQKVAGVQWRRMEFADKGHELAALMRQKDMLGTMKKLLQDEGRTKPQ